MGHNSIKNIELAAKIRPMRLTNSNLIEYSTITWDEKPSLMIMLWLNRIHLFTNCNAAHGIGNCLIDILDKNGDVIADVKLNYVQFEFLRRKLGFKVVSKTKN